MSNIDRISLNSKTHIIGGKTFNDAWVYLDTFQGNSAYDDESSHEFWLFHGDTFTADQYVTYSLDDILPKDEYIYECEFGCYIRTGTTSGNLTRARIYSGTVTASSNGNAPYPFYNQMAAVRARAASNRAEGGWGLLPIFPSDRAVTFRNSEGSGTSGACGLSLIRYRRIGINE